MRIVPIALSKYFLNNIPVEQTIKNHTDIYDYCLRLRVNKGWNAIYKYINSDLHFENKKLSKNTRYFISNSGGALYKENVQTKKLHGVNVGYITTLFNKYYSDDMINYNINYSFYVKECKKIIDSIENKQLTLF